MKKKEEARKIRLLFSWLKDIDLSAVMIVTSGGHPDYITGEKMLI
jgi:hypothetical protein